MNWLGLIYSISCLVIVFSALWGLRFSNFNEKTRYRQWTSPIMAFVVTLIACGFYIYNYDKFVKGPIDFIFGIFDLVIQPEFITNRVFYAIDIGWSLLIIYVFGIIKRLVNTFLLRSAKYKTNYLPDLPNKKPPEFAYYVNSEELIVLRRDWLFVYHFFKWALLIASGLFTISVIIVAFWDWKVPPGLFVIPIFLCLEVYWFMNGPQQDMILEKEEEEEEAEDKEVIRAAYHKLWEEYQTVWPEKLMMAWNYSDPEEMESYKTEDASTIQDASELLKNGFKITDREYQILENISSNKDVIVGNVRYNELAPVLFAGILRKLLNGKHVLILTPEGSFSGTDYHNLVEEWVRHWLQKLSGNALFWEVQNYDRYVRGKLTAPIVVSSAEELLEHRAVQYDWFDDLTCVLFLYGAKTFATAATSNNILLQILRDKNPDLQSIICSEYRRELQGGIKRNLGINMEIRETRIIPRESLFSFLLIWQQEGPGLFQQKALVGDVDAYLGAEAILALPAWRDKVAEIELVQAQKLPWFEHLEEIRNNIDRFNRDLIPAGSLKGDSMDNVACHDYTIKNAVHDSVFYCIRDDEFNVISCFEEWKAYGRHHVFMNIVSPPYLLRDYFIENFPYFKDSPFYAFTVAIMESRFTIAMTLMEKLVNQKLTEKEIRSAFRQAGLEAGSIRAGVEQLFNEAFGLEMASGEFLMPHVSYEYSDEKNSYGKVFRYALSPDIRNHLELQFLSAVQIGEQTGNNVLRVLPYDLLFQNYLPGQLHTFNGRSYEIEDYDASAKFLRVHNVNPKAITAYRQDVRVKLDKLLAALVPAHESRPQDGVQLKLLEGRYSVFTNGYFTFLQGIKLRDGNAEYTYNDLQRRNIPERKYALGRMLVLSLTPKRELDIPKVATTVCTLLTELMPTLFPESYQYIHICSPEAAFEGRFDQLYPSFEMGTAAGQGGKLNFYFFEDAHQDLGLVNSVYREWKTIFYLLDDYLQWVISGNKGKGELKGVFRPQEINATDFLSYGFDSPPAHLSINDTSLFLHDVIGSNSLSSSRQLRMGV